MPEKQTKSSEQDFAVSDQNSEADTPSERLRRAVKNAGGNQQVAARANVPLASLNAYIAGREMRISAAYKLAEACGVSLEWLITGVESGLALPPIMRGIEAIIDGKTGEPQPLTEVIEFPKYEVRLSAGHGSVAQYTQEIIPSFLALPRFLLPKEIIALAPHLIAVDVSGDSMTPTLSDGDTLLVDTRVQAVISGSVYAIRADDEVLVKRLNRHLDGNIEVISDNPRFKPQIIEAETARRLWADGEAPLRIIGKVLWRMGSAI